MKAFSLFKLSIDKSGSKPRVEARLGYTSHAASQARLEFLNDALIRRLPIGMSYEVRGEKSWPKFLA